MIKRHYVYCQVCVATHKQQQLVCVVHPTVFRDYKSTNLQTFTLFDSFIKVSFY